MTLPEPTLLCREAEAWAATFAYRVAHAEYHADWSALMEVPQRVVLSVDDARSLASLLTQLATLARAESSRL